MRKLAFITGPKDMADPVEKENANVFLPLFSRLLFLHSKKEERYDPKRQNHRYIPRKKGLVKPKRALTYTEAENKKKNWSLLKLAVALARSATAF